MQSLSERRDGGRAIALCCGQQGDMFRHKLWSIADYATGRGLVEDTIQAEFFRHPTGEYSPSCYLYTLTAPFLLLVELLLLADREGVHPLCVR